MHGDVVLLMNHAVAFRVAVRMAVMMVVFDERV
jgi:hypothetical protein